MRTNRYKVYSYPFLSSFTKDYKTSAFELRIEPGKSGKRIAVRIEYNLANDELVQEVEQGLLKVIIRANCNPCSFTKVWSFAANQKNLLVDIDPLEVDGSVYFTGYLVAQKNFDLTNADLSEEWKGISSRVQTNNIIGETDDCELYVKHEGKGKKQSIFSFVYKADMKDGEPVRMLLNGERIVFCLAKKEHMTYKAIQGKSWPIILGTILVPAFTEILTSMKSETDPQTGEIVQSKFSNDYSGKNWYQLIRTRYINILHKEPEAGAIDPYKAAQQLLKCPTVFAFNYAVEAQNNKGKVQAYEEH